MKKTIKLPPGVTPAEVLELERMMSEIGPDKVREMNKAGELREVLKSRVKMRQEHCQDVYQRMMQSVEGKMPLESATIWAATKAAEAGREMKMMD